MTLNFEWDEVKAAQNQRKHGISFEEAKTVFNDPFALTIVDPKHSTNEKRFIELGFSSRVNLLVVVYTERHSNIRIISCRKATKKERKAYERRK